MTTLEQIEKLRERANVSYDEAKQALETAEGDLLAALISLEKQGKVEPPKGGGYYSSEGVDPQNDEEEILKPKQGKPNCDGFMKVLDKIGKFVVEIINKGNSTGFEVIQNDLPKAKLPVTVMVLLILFVPWVIIPLLIVGLFFGFSYRFVGADQ